MSQSLSKSVSMYWSLVLIHESWIESNRVEPMAKYHTEISGISPYDTLEWILLHWKIYVWWQTALIVVWLKWHDKSTRSWSAQHNLAAHNRNRSSYFVPKTERRGVGNGEELTTPHRSNDATDKKRWNELKWQLAISIRESDLDAMHCRSPNLWLMP